MSFFRHPEIFRSDVVVQPTKLGPGYRLPLVGPEAQSKDATEGTRPAHRLDESPADYSSVGWSPPEPTSASPAEYDCAVTWSCRSRSFHRTANCVLTVCVSPGGKGILIRWTSTYPLWFGKWE